MHTPRETLHISAGVCSLGPIFVARSPRGLCAISLGHDDLPALFPNSTLLPDQPAALTAAIRLVDTQLPLEIPLDMRGTPFQHRVWKALQTIPPGHTGTYTQIAHQIGAPTSTRAVASACAANTLAVAIPCRRAIRSNGSLAGYRWGLHRKQTLLLLESQ